MSTRYPGSLQIVANTKILLAELVPNPGSALIRSKPNLKLFSMLIIRTLNNYPDSSDFLKFFTDFLGRERGGGP